VDGVLDRRQTNEIRESKRTGEIHREPNEAIAHPQPLDLGQLYDEDTLNRSRRDWAAR